MDETSCRTEKVASVATEPATPAAAPAGADSLESDKAESSSGWKALFLGSDPAVQNTRYLTTLSYLLTVVVVSGIIFGKMRREGIYADQYLWMRYQTLLTPASYTDYIWIPLFVLQGLFIYGSLLPFKNSPLVGYTALTTPHEHDNNDQRVKTYINCPIILYPGMCAMSIFMVYSYDHAYTLFAMVYAVLATLLCSKIMSLQLHVLAEADAAVASAAASFSSDVEAVVSDPSDVNDVKMATPSPLSIGFLMEYTSLRLPFELFGGYSLCLVFLYLNTWLHLFGLNPKALVITANTSILALLVIAAYILWGLKQGHGRHLYGVAVSMVWFLVGVAVELQAPTQPIYNEFSDSQIMTTQILAGLASTLLSSLLAIRMIKTVIKRNMFNCIVACQGNDADDEVGDEVEGDITTGYVHA